MNKTYAAGAIILGLSVFCLLGAYGAGNNTVGLLLMDFGVPERYSENASRSISGGLFAVAIFLLVYGYRSESDGRVVSHEEFVEVKKQIESESE